MSTPDTAAAESIKQDDSGLSVMRALYRAVIGPISQDYYLPIFTLFEQIHRTRPSWNMAASLYTLNWMIFRRLWGAALAYAVFLVCVVGVLLGTDALAWELSDIPQVLTSLVLLALYYLIPGFFGNWLLFVAMRKKVERTLAASKTFKEACNTLAGQASTRSSFVILVITDLVLICLVLLAYLMRPDGHVPAAVDVPKSAVSGVVNPRLAVSEPTSSASAVKPTLGEMPIPAMMLVSTVMPVSATRSTSAPASAAVPASAAMSASAVSAAASAPTQAASLPKPSVSATESGSKFSSTPAQASRPAAVKTAAKTVQAPVPPSSVPTAQYYVNVGLFANESNARFAQAKLIDANVVSFRQALTTPKGKLIRVRAGPFDSKAQAEAAAKTIRELGLDAVVFRP